MTRNMGLSLEAIRRIAQQMDTGQDNVSYLPGNEPSAPQTSGGGNAGSEIQELKDWVEYLIAEVDNIKVDEMNQNIQLLNDWVNTLIDRVETVEQGVATPSEPAVQETQQTQQQYQDPGTQSWQKFKDTFNPTKWNWDL